MWYLKPYKSPPSYCPKCAWRNPGFGTHLFIGAHILGKGTCSKCGTTYFHNWPIGHGLEFPLCFDENGLAVYPAKAEQWLARPLIKAVKKDLRVSGKIKRQVRKKITHGLLLNCLDSCYGHILWKLFNTSLYNDVSPPQGVVVLIPENCVWLVPQSVAEVWSVEVDLKDINCRIDSLEPFIGQVLYHFESVRLLPALTHIDHSNIDFYRYFQTRPFQLSEFQLRQPCLTFIWREDRLWVRTHIEEWIDLIAKKLAFSWLNRWLLFRQLKSLVKVGERVRQSIPKARIQVIGLGTWGSFPGDFEDTRQTNLTVEWEKKWCNSYSRSHLVVGVHGSSMLIPTALAGGFIELMPKHKIPYTTEDILMKHPPRFQTFLGRHLPLYSTPGQLAAHIISIFKDFDYLYKNTTATT